MSNLGTILHGPLPLLTMRAQRNGCEFIRNSKLDPLPMTWNGVFSSFRFSRYQDLCNSGAGTMCCESVFRKTRACGSRPMPRSSARHRYGLADDGFAA